MKIDFLEIKGPIVFTPHRFSDDRGYFTETFNINSMREAGISKTAWVQDNQSFSERAYTLRGLHFQIAPSAQAKLVRVLKGSIFDVAVNIRPNSPGFGKWVGVVLDSEKMNQLYIPAGFAHGFLTLEPNVEVFYKVSAVYSKTHDRAVAWNDPALNISWPLPAGIQPQLSLKDQLAPLLSQLKNEPV